MTARTISKLQPRCGNEGPDLALPGVEAAGTSTRDAITDLSRMLPAVRLIGTCTGHQSERHVGEQRGVGMHQAASVRRGVPTLPHHLDHAVGKMEGDRLSLQGSSEPVPILEQAELSAITPRVEDVLAPGNAGPTAAQIADRVGVTHKTIDNHTQRIYSRLDVHRQLDAVSVAFQRGIPNGEYAPVRQSGPDLRSSA